jgi:hypothetical protein
MPCNWRFDSSTCLYVPTSEGDYMNNKYIEVIKELVIQLNLADRKIIQHHEVGVTAKDFGQCPACSSEQFSARAAVLARAAVVLATED